MDNIATLYDGPFDGAELQFDGDVWPAEIIMATVRKLDSDTGDICRGVTLHQYSNTYTWDSEDEDVVRHYMGHVAHKAMTIDEMNAMFPPKGMKRSPGDIDEVQK